MTDELTAEEMAHTLRSEAGKVRRWLRSHRRHFEARQYAGYDTHDEAQVRRWLDMLARNLDMDAEELEEHGNTRHAEEDPRTQGRHRGGGRPAGHVAVPHE